MLRDAPVRLFHGLHGAAHQLVQKSVALRLGAALLGVERIEVTFGGFFHWLPAHVPQEENLQRPLARPAAGRHQLAEPAPPGLSGAWRNWRIRLAISMPAMAASNPLLPLLAPARSIACSSVLHVSTPKATGTPLSAAACPIPFTASPAT